MRSFHIFAKTYLAHSEKGLIVITERKEADSFARTSVIIYQLSKSNEKFIAPVVQQILERRENGKQFNRR